MDVFDEQEQLRGLIKGKTVIDVVRDRVDELIVHFSDGTRLIVDINCGQLELSVTGGED